MKNDEVKNDEVEVVDFFSLVVVPPQFLSLLVVVGVSVVVGVRNPNDDENNVEATSNNRSIQK